MQQTQTLKIFLGSSITELKDERVNISDSISQDLTHLFQQDDIVVYFFKCEGIHDGYSGQPDQDEIDNTVRKCDISLFVFKDKEGPYTIHEYEVARALQKERTHKIFVFYFHKEEGKQPEKLTPFQERLKADGVFWRKYTDVIDLKYQFTLGLLKYLNVRCGASAHAAEEVKKSGDELFEQCKHDHKLMHQEIEKLLAQVDPVMKDPGTPISAKINNVIGIYQKADLWASKTDYDKEKYSDLLANYAQFLYKNGLYRDAESVWLRQIPLAEVLFGTEHKYTATSYNEIGLVYWYQCKYSKALEFHQMSLAIKKKVLGTEHPDTAIAYNNIGMVFKKQGDYDKALEYYQKAMEIDKKVLGKEHPDTATDYNNIGKVYDAQDDYTQALEYYQKAMVIWEKELGMEHPNTATSYNNIGAVYYAQGDYGKALEFYQKALAIREKVLGTEHPDTAISYHNIGAVYYEMKEYPKALEYLREALVIRKSKLGDEHPDTKGTQGWIDLTKAAMGENSETE